MTATNVVVPMKKGQSLRDMVSRSKQTVAANVADDVGMNENDISFGHTSNCSVYVLKSGAKALYHAVLNEVPDNGLTRDEMVDAVLDYVDAEDEIGSNRQMNKAAWKAIEDELMA